jgi:hypothetical protein
LREARSAMPLTLDIAQALRFLDALDPDGRHTLASEAPFGGAGGGPRWEEGGTYEHGMRPALIKGIQERQQRGSNVYYGVNRPCPTWQQKGQRGKCNVEDIIAIRALAFDVDIIKRPFNNALLVNFIDREFLGVLRPSFVINTGGGFHLIYILHQPHNVALFRPAVSNDQETANNQAEYDRRNITMLSQDFELLLRQKVPAELREHIKIDNMSNVDRVMRLPGTINYPKREKIDRGQVPALAHIAVDYQCKCNMAELRKKVPCVTVAPSSNVHKLPFVQRPNSKWPPYRKALDCCEFIRDHELADFNAIYVLEVMLPLIGAWLDEELTVEEAEECFLEAVSGGARYGMPGRGLGYFKRQFRSHLGSRPGKHRHLGNLINFCKEHGYVPPWIDEVSWDSDFQRQKEDLSKPTAVSVDVKKLFGEM